MKLNRSQRFTAYCIMLKETEKGLYSGFCALWSDILDLKTLYYDFKSTLPELYAKKTNGQSSIYYFNNDKERRKALKQCIAETSPH